MRNERNVQLRTKHKIIIPLKLWVLTYSLITFFIKPTNAHTTRTLVKFINPLFFTLLLIL